VAGTQTSTGAAGVGAISRVAWPNDDTHMTLEISSGAVHRRS